MDAKRAASLSGDEASHADADEFHDAEVDEHEKKTRVPDGDETVKDDGWDEWDDEADGETAAAHTEHAAHGTDTHASPAIEPSAEAEVEATQDPTEAPLDVPAEASVPASSEALAASAATAPAGPEPAAAADANDADTPPASVNPTTPAASVDAPMQSLSVQDDDFGDFDDDEFGDDFVEATPVAAPPPVAVPPPAPASPAPQYACVDAESSLDALRATIQNLLPAEYTDASAVPASDIESNVSHEGLRQIEGLSQVLSNDKSRTLFRELQAPLPIPSTPLDWTRSVTRRQHLISLGIPINLDEVHQPAWSRSAPLPPLELHVEPSKGPVPQESAAAPAERAPAPPAEPAAPAESWGERRRRELGGPAPAVDMDRVEHLANLSSDQLALKALPELRAMAKEMQTLSQQTSDLLAHHLMIREAFNADAEVYNATIRELVAGASNKLATKKAEKRGLLSRASSLRRSRPSTPNEGT